jgi:hypothetical protein
MGYLLMPLVRQPCIAANPTDSIHFNPCISPRVTHFSSFGQRQNDNIEGALVLKWECKEEADFATN